MPSFRRKITIEARQNDGTPETAAAIKDWIGTYASVGVDADGNATVTIVGASRATAKISDWVVKLGIAGATYADADFQQLYEAVS